MSKELWDKGLAVRKEVLGAEYVERNLASADDFQHADAGAGDPVLLGLAVGRGRKCHARCEV